jgi:hypothetical protein
MTHINVQAMFRQAVTRSAQAARAPPLSARPRFFGAQQTEQTAYMFGRKPGAAKEGWEDIVYPCYAASAFVLIFGLAARPEADIKDWAREEALARLAVKEKGGEVRNIY